MAQGAGHSRVRRRGVTPAAVQKKSPYMAGFFIVYFGSDGQSCGCVNVSAGEGYPLTMHVHTPAVSVGIRSMLDVTKSGMGSTVTSMGEFVPIRYPMNPPAMGYTEKAIPKYPIAFTQASAKLPPVTLRYSNVNPDANGREANAEELGQDAFIAAPSAIPADERMWLAGELKSTRTGGTALPGY